MSFLWDHLNLSIILLALKQGRYHLNECVDTITKTTQQHRNITFNDYSDNCQSLPRYLISFPMYTFPATNKVTSAFESKSEFRSGQPFPRRRSCTFPSCSWMQLIATEVKRLAENDEDVRGLVGDTERRIFLTETRRYWGERGSESSLILDLDFEKADVLRERIAWDQKSLCGLLGW